MGSREPRLLDQVHGRVRRRHYSIRAEQVWVAWTRRFILANGRRHPREMGQYPHADAGQGWQSLFPAARRSLDRRSARRWRHHVADEVLQCAVKAARVRAGITRPANCTTPRHSFATHLLGAGHDIRTMRELPGHKDVATTRIYAQVPGRGASAVASPLDRLHRTRRGARAVAGIGDGYRAAARASPLTTPSDASPATTSTPGNIARTSTGTYGERDMPPVR